MGVARSTLSDSRAAAAAATRDALTGPDPQLLLVFFAISHDPTEIIEGIRSTAPGVPLAGCSTHGEIAPGGPTDDTIVVAAIGGPGIAAAVGFAGNVEDRQRAAGIEVAQCVALVPDLPHKVLMLFTDGKVRDQETILRGCYEVVGASIPFVGGAAGDGWKMDQTLVIANDKVSPNAVVGVAIASEAPLSVAYGHGWQKTGEPMIVTRSEHGRVYTLDDKPAMDAYLDRLGAPPEAYTDETAFRDFALARPLGIQRRSGVEARNLSTGIDLEGRSIGSAGAIDHGGLTWAMTGDEASILAATDSVCSAALAGLGDRELIGMITLSCAALRAVLGDEGIQRENERIAKWARDAPFAGFYTYGEIARIRGIDGFHNQTLAVLAIT